MLLLAGVESSNANQQCRATAGRPCAGGRRIIFENSFLDLPSTALAGPGCSIDTPLGGPTCSEFPVTPSLVTNGNQQVNCNNRRAAVVCTAACHTPMQSITLTLPSGCTGSGSCSSGNFYDPVVSESASSFLVASIAAVVVAALLAVL